MNKRKTPFIPYETSQNNMKPALFHPFTTHHSPHPTKPFESVKMPEEERKPTSSIIRHFTVLRYSL